MKKILFQYCLIIGILICSCSMASAHRINVFCWVEEGEIQCYSKFSTGNPVKEGDYKVYDSTGKLLYEAKGDKKGNFHYKIPKSILEHPEDLKIECIAEMGHKNFWVVKKDEIVPSSDMEEESSSYGEEEGSSLQSPPKENKKVVGIDRKELEKILSKVLERELAPIKMDLAMLKEHPIQIRDVLGGIGYILGIMGIFLYFKSKNS